MAEAKTFRFGRKSSYIVIAHDENGFFQCDLACYIFYILPVVRIERTEAGSLAFDIDRAGPFFFIFIHPRPMPDDALDQYAQFDLAAGQLFFELAVTGNKFIGFFAGGEAFRVVVRL